MMKKPILGLRTTIYKVTDITAAKQWYTKAFATEPYFDEPFYVGFEIGGYELGLQPQEDQNNEKQDNVIAYWGVESIKEEYQRFLDLGATVLAAPKNVGGDIEVAAVNDPWGNAIGLIYNPNFRIG